MLDWIEPVVMWSFEDACKALNEEPKRIREILKHTPITFEDVEKRVREKLLMTTNPSHSRASEINEIKALKELAKKLWVEEIKRALLSGTNDRNLHILKKTETICSWF